MEHTQGKLTFARRNAGSDVFVAYDSASFAVFKTVNARGNGEDGPANFEANARRLVACWNACDGVSTEFLEQLAAMPDNAIASYEALKAQRDELVALLTESQTSIGGDWRERRDALIAKHKGANHG